MKYIIQCVSVTGSPTWVTGVSEPVDTGEGSSPIVSMVNREAKAKRFTREEVDAAMPLVSTSHPEAVIVGLAGEDKEDGNLGGFTLLKGQMKPGQCAECAVFHREDQPHNQQSLYYQYKFMEEHGRWPKWSDAMAHCTPELREVWTRELKKAGVKEDQFT